MGGQDAWGGEPHQPLEPVSLQARHGVASMNVRLNFPQLLRSLNDERYAMKWTTGCCKFSIFNDLLALEVENFNPAQCPDPLGPDPAGIFPAQAALCCLLYGYLWATVSPEYPAICSGTTTPNPLLASLGAADKICLAGTAAMPTDQVDQQL